MSPEDAGMDALKRIARNFNNDMTRLSYLNMFYYILRKDGAFAGVSLWSGRGDGPRRYAVHDGTRRYETAKYLFEGQARDWPPMPQVPK
jgi:N4-(beta-N-acetylglucosaminyl)-L-asparaginase